MDAVLSTESYLRDFFRAGDRLKDAEGAMESFEDGASRDAFFLTKEAAESWSRRAKNGSRTFGVTYGMMAFPRLEIQTRMAVVQNRRSEDRGRHGGYLVLSVWILFGITLCCVT